MKIKKEVAKKMTYDGPNDSAGFHSKRKDIGLKGKEKRNALEYKASRTVSKPLMMKIGGRMIPYSEWVKTKKNK